MSSQPLEKRLLYLPNNPTAASQPQAGRLLRPPPRVSFDRFLNYLSQNWNREDGGHITVIAPTGRGGKTFFVTRGLLPFFEDFRVLFIDVKDKDKTVFPPNAKPYFKHRVQRFPTRLQIEWASPPKHFHLHVRSGLAGGGSLREQSLTIWEAVSRAYKQKDWIVVADEIGFLTSHFPDGLGLGGMFKDIWRRGRSSTSLIAMTQHPSWIPTEAYSQPTHLLLGRMNAEGNKRLGEIGGTVDYKVVRDALGGVKRREFLYLNKAAEQPEDEMMITGL
jgi:hypothetical protein